MRNIFSEIKRKKRAIWMVAALLVTYNALRLLSIVAAPYPVDQIVNMDAGISLSEYQVAFQNFINEESAILQMSPDSLKITILYSGCVAAGYIIFSLFLGMRKKFARYAILGLVSVEIVMDIVIGIKYSILPSKISIIIAIILLLFLFSHNIAKEFK
jgi:membrane-associated PAP2 superfamily phosphatase